jgi:hypothetical protein
MRIVIWTVSGGIGLGLGKVVAVVAAIGAVGYAAGKGVEKVLEMIND